MRAEQGFAQAYPTSYASSVTNSQMTADAYRRWSNSLEAYRTAIAVQSQAQMNFASDQASLTDLVNQSQSAVGALQATQTTNQLLALHARQMIAEQQLRITQDRALALEAARSVAAGGALARGARAIQCDGRALYTSRVVRPVRRIGTDSTFRASARYE